MTRDEGAEVTHDLVTSDQAEGDGTSGDLVAPAQEEGGGTTSELMTPPVTPLYDEEAHVTPAFCDEVSQMRSYGDLVQSEASSEVSGQLVRRRRVAKKGPSSPNAEGGRGAVCLEPQRYKRLNMAIDGAVYMGVILSWLCLVLLFIDIFVSWVRQG